MSPDLRAAIDKLPDGMRQEVAALIEEGERERARLKFEDLGYDECDVCRQARLRTQWICRPALLPSPTHSEASKGA